MKPAPSHKAERYLVVAQRLADVLAGETMGDAQNALSAVFVQLCKQTGLSFKEYRYALERMWKDEKAHAAIARMRHAIDNADADVLAEDMLKKAQKNVDPMKKTKPKD